MKDIKDLAQEFLMWLCAIMIISYLGFCLIGLIVGGGAALNGHLSCKDTGFSCVTTYGCTYKSIASRINIGYIGMCELFKPRF